MKILFVEDEITKNIPRLIRLFSRYLGKEIIDKLNELNESQDGYAPTPEEIKKIVESTDLIDIEYSFSGSLNKVINGFRNYELFIIDRNLVEADYKFNDIVQIDSSFNEKLFNDHWEREGDYLLCKLIHSGVDVLNKFYFLTAYPASQEIISAKTVQHYIEFDRFQIQNFIDKSNPDDFNRLKEIVENIDTLNIQADNKVYVDILRKYFDHSKSENFIELIIDKDNETSGEIEKNLGRIRTILENVLAVLAHRIKIPDSYWDKNKNIKIRPMINYLIGPEKNKDDQTVYHFNYNTNTLIKDYLYNIYEICSDFGSHSNYSQENGGYQPTLNTVNSLIYALKEIILWFNSAIPF